MKVTFKLGNQSPTPISQIPSNIYFIGKVIFANGDKDTNVWVFKTDEVGVIYRIASNPFNISRVCNLDSIEDYKEVNLELVVTEKT